MGHSHDHSHSPAVTEASTPLEKKQARVLKIVFALNAGMAVIEGVTGYLAHSKAMLADTLDMAGDALASGGSVIVQKKSPRVQAGVALAKAGVMAVMGLGVLGAAVFAIANPVMPVMAVMGIVGAMALAVNTASFALLYPHRNDNINMKSTMLCMRNDMISNVAVLAAAAAGALLVSPIPDIVVGIAISGLFIKSSVEIGREALAILRPKKDAEKQEKAPAPKPKKPQPENKFSLKKTVTAFFNCRAGKACKIPLKPAPRPPAPPQTGAKPA